MNGRMGKDRLVGKGTCKSVSVVDYCIANHEFLSLVNDFEILGFSNLYSDCHNPIYVELNVSISNNVYENTHAMHNTGVGKAKAWNDDFKQTFIDSVSQKRTEVDILCEMIDTKDLNEIDTEFIDNAVKETCHILLSCAKDTFGVKMDVKLPGKRKIEFHKPLFTTECKNARQSFRKAKRLYRRYGSIAFKEDVYSKEKLYKRVLKKSVNNHRKQTMNKIKTLRTTNLKEYWKIINSGLKKDKKVNVPTTQLFDFFKDLNEEKNIELPDYVLTSNEVEILSNLQCNDSINSPITCDEIQKCIKDLKRNKACGGDDIYNEYIKSSCDIMLPIYHKLFNKIFDSGYYPSDWLSGEIIPLYKNKGDDTNPKLEAQGPCTGHRSSIAILYCFSFKYMKREKGRDLTQYTNLCGLNTLPH